MPLHGTSGTDRVGIEPDLAALLARTLGRRLELVDRATTGTDALGSVATGKADLALSAVTPTPERAKRVDFTRPYHTVEVRLAGPPLDSLADLAGKRIAVAGAVSASLAREAKLPGTLVPVKTVRDAIAAVLSKQADYALDEDLALLAEIRGTSLALAEPKVADSPIAAAVPKGRAAEWDAVLAKVGPELEQIRRRWRHYHVAFRQLDAGCSIHCGILSGGELACFGQMAGSAPPPSGTFTAVAAGDHHACALRTDGTVACWGRDDSGQAKPPKGEFVKVSAGFTHTCALARNGRVTCWGSNGSGESAAPTGIFADVAAGFRTSCAIRSEGHAVVCWGKRPLSLTDSYFHSVAVGDGVCALGANGKPFCAGASDGKPYALNETFLEVAAGSRALCGLGPDGKVRCWDGGFPRERALSITGISLQCNVLCGLASDGAPVCIAEDPGARSPEFTSLRLAGGEEVFVAEPREASGAVPAGNVAIAFCDRTTTIRKEKFGEGVWKLGAVLDSRGTLRPVAEDEAPATPETWYVAGGSPKDRVKIGGPCKEVALAAAAPLTATAAPRGPAADISRTGERWATVRGAAGEVLLGLMEESYDPVLTGGYTEAQLKADHEGVGTGGLRPHRCFHLILRAVGADDQEIMLPDPYACGEGD